MHYLFPNLVNTAIDDVGFSSFLNLEDRILMLVQSHTVILVSSLKGIHGLTIDLIC